MKDQHDSQTADLLGEEQKRGKGRPRKYADKAEKQRAYRAKLKAEGKRVVTRIVKDVRDQAAPLTSEIIDLSEVKK